MDRVCFREIFLFEQREPSCIRVGDSYEGGTVLEIFSFNNYLTVVIDTPQSRSSFHPQTQYVFQNVAFKGIKSFDSKAPF